MYSNNTYYKTRLKHKSLYLGFTAYSLTHQTRLKWITSCICVRIWLKQINKQLQFRGLSRKNIKDMYYIIKSSTYTGCPKPLLENEFINNTGAFLIQSPFFLYGTLGCAHGY